MYYKIEKAPEIALRGLGVFPLVRGSGVAANVPNQQDDGALVEIRARGGRRAIHANLLVPARKTELGTLEGVGDRLAVQGETDQLNLAGQSPDLHFNVVRHWRDLLLSYVDAQRTIGLCGRAVLERPAGDQSRTDGHNQLVLELIVATLFDRKPPYHLPDCESRDDFRRGTHASLGPTR